MTTANDNLQCLLGNGACSFGGAAAGEGGMSNSAEMQVFNPSPVYHVDHQSVPEIAETENDLGTTQFPSPGMNHEAEEQTSVEENMPTKFMFIMFAMKNRWTSDKIDEFYGEADTARSILSEAVEQGATDIVDAIISHLVNLREAEEIGGPMPPIDELEDATSSPEPARKKRKTAASSSATEKRSHSTASSNLAKAAAAAAVQPTEDDVLLGVDEHPGTRRYLALLKQSNVVKAYQQATSIVEKAQVGQAVINTIHKWGARIFENVAKKDKAPIWRLVIPVEPHEPGEEDVLLGRGGESNNYPGNDRYLNLARSADVVQDYIQAGDNKFNKTLVAKSVIDAVHNRGGRFIRNVAKKSANKEVCPPIWCELSAKNVQVKVKQAIRDEALRVKKDQAIQEGEGNVS